MEIKEYRKRNKIYFEKKSIKDKIIYDLDERKIYRIKGKEKAEKRIYKTITFFKESNVLCLNDIEWKDKKMKEIIEEFFVKEGEITGKNNGMDRLQIYKDFEIAERMLSVGYSIESLKCDRSTIADVRELDENYICNINNNIVKLLINANSNLSGIEDLLSIDQKDISNKIAKYILDNKIKISNEKMKNVFSNRSYNKIGEIFSFLKKEFNCEYKDVLEYLFITMPDKQCVDDISIIEYIKYLKLASKYKNGLEEIDKYPSFFVSKSRRLSHIDNVRDLKDTEKDSNTNKYQYLDYNKEGDSFSAKAELNSTRWMPQREEKEIKIRIQNKNNKNRIVLLYVMENEDGLKYESHSNRIKGLNYYDIDINSEEIDFLKKYMKENNIECNKDIVCREKKMIQDRNKNLISFEYIENGKKALYDINSGDFFIVKNGISKKIKNCYNFFKDANRLSDILWKDEKILYIIRHIGLYYCDMFTTSSFIKKIYEYRSLEQFFDAGIYYRNLKCYSITDFDKRIIKMSKKYDVDIIKSRFTKEEVDKEEKKTKEMLYNIIDFLNENDTFSKEEVAGLFINGSSRFFIGANEYKHRQDFICILCELQNKYNCKYKSVLKYIRSESAESVRYFGSRSNSPIMYDTITEFYDFISAEYDMKKGKTSEIEKYPKYFASAHIISMHNYKEIESEIKNKKIYEVYKNNKSLEYQGEKYSIILPKNVNDIKVEGDNMMNCVMSYTKYVISGKKVIMMLRESENINKSLITIELSNDEIVQARRKKNWDLTKEEKDFLLKYAKEKKLAVCERIQMMGEDNYEIK